MSRTTRPLIQVDANNRPIQISEEWTTYRGDAVGTELIYAGYAKPGSDEGAGVWQIMKFAYDGSSNLVSIKYPTKSDGSISADYEFIWTNRASYTYQ